MQTNGYPRLLFVCAEFYPLAKTGGLADVCAALPRALAREGTRREGDVARVSVRARQCRGRRKRSCGCPMADGYCRLATPDNLLPIYLFDQPELFRRPGGPYQDPERRDWPDNHRRYAAFCRAATALALHGDAAGWVAGSGACT